MQKLSFMLVFLLLPLGSPLPAQADIVGDIVTETAGKVFSEAERGTIKDYYRDKHAAYGGKTGRGLPPGLARRDTLPPGLEMQLERNGRLPPGLEKQALPGDLIGRLPPVPRGYERVIVDAHVVLVETASQIIADIITDVVFQN
jgi:hypothetical protein